MNKPQRKSLIHRRLHKLSYFTLLLLRSSTNNAQHTPRKCPSRPVTPTTSITSYSDLKQLLESSSTDVVLPSFHITKTDESPIVLNKPISISCVSGGECILSSSRGGTFIEIRGEKAHIQLLGFTFEYAKESAIVVAKRVGDGLEHMICESSFIGNQGHLGGAIRTHPKTKVHIESCIFSQNVSISGTSNKDEYGAGGGAVYNEGEMSVWSSTFEDNSSQIGVIYTGAKSKLSLSQNTFMIGDKQDESSSIYVFADDSDNYIDEGGNMGHDEIMGNQKTISYCSGIYVNNEDECRSFAQQPLQQFELGNMQVVNDLIDGMQSQTICTNTRGLFRNHLGDSKKCLWLLNDSRRSLNCNGLTELGRMCRKSCLEDCSIPLPKNRPMNRRKRKREKIMKKRQREQEEKLKASQLSPGTTTQLQSKEPMNRPTRLPSPRPTPFPTHNLSNPEPSNNVKPSSQTQNKAPDVVFYVIGDAPYKVSELDPTTGFPHQVRGIPVDAEFVVHVGDILSAKESECHISWYQQVSFILRSSNAPVFITPGDNDWLDCEPYIGAKVALDQWQSTFDRFHTSWSPHKFDVQHQPSLTENMAFVHKRVLFLIIHLVSDYYDIERERQLRHSSQLAWMNYLISSHKSNIDAIVIIGHSPPSSLNRDFFSARYGGISTTIEKLDMPVLYIHGSGHKFVEEENFNHLDNFLRIQVPGRQANPVRVSFDESKRFYFDFNDDTIVTKCCVDGWPKVGWPRE